MPYVVGDVKTQTVEPGNSLSKAADPDGIGWRRLEVRGQARPDADRHHQSRLRPGRSRPGRRQSVGVRNVLLRAAAVLRRGLRHLPASISTATTAVAAGCSIRAESAARPGAARRCQTAGSRRAPAQTTILGAAKLTGRHRRLFHRRAERRSRPKRTRSSSTARSRTRQAIEPLTGYNVIRARREFKNQSAFGFMATRDQPEAGRGHEVSARAGVHRRRRLGLAAERKYADQGFLAGSGVRGDAAAIDELQRNNVHLFQRPDSTTLEDDPDADVAQRLWRLGTDQQDRRPARPVFQQRRRSRAPDSRSTTSASCSAPIADDEQLDAGALRHAVEVSAQLPLQPESMGGLERGRRSVAVGRQRQRPRGVHEQLGQPAWA